MRHPVIAALAVLLFAAAPSAQGEPPRIKLGTLAPSGSSVHGRLLEMRDEWRRAPGGGVDLIVFADGTMGGEYDMVRRLRSGQLQAAALTSVGLAAIEPSVGAVQFLPMVFRSWEEVDVVRESIRGDLEARLRAKGLVVLFWADAGWVRYFSREAYRVPADLKKLRIFAWAAQPEPIELMKALGFRPVALETADILPGLNTGLLDVVPTTAVFANAGQLYRRAPYVSSIRWAPIFGAGVVSAKTWEALPEEIRPHLARAAEAAGARIRTQSRKEDEEALTAMGARGLVVHQATPEEEAEWRRVAETVHPRLRGPQVPEEVFDRVMAVLAAHRSPGAR